MQKSAHFPFSPTFFDQIKNVKTEKHRSPQLNFVCKKNFHFSKEKIDFWPFSCFGQNHKNGQKTIFYFEKWKFFSHTLIIWGDEIFSFFTLFDSVKKSWRKWKKYTFVHGPFLQFLAQKCQKYPFSKICSMSNFGEKMFSPLFTKMGICTR